MVHAGYTILGAGELRAALIAAGLGLDDLKDANARVSRFVADVARTMAPTAETRDLQGTVRGSRQARRAVVRAGTARVRYAGPIHYGWPNRPNVAKGWRGGPITAQPWIIDAARRTERFWLTEYTRDIDRIIDKIGASTP